MGRPAVLGGERVRDIDLDQLRQVAGAATGGNWRVTRDPLGTHVETGLDGGGHGRIVFGSSVDRGTEKVQADAEYIAAFDPATAIALLDRLAELEGMYANRRRAFARAWDEGYSTGYKQGQDYPFRSYPGNPYEGEIS